MTDRRAPDREGFSLIEMLVALAVFGLAAMALLNLSGESTRSAARVETRTLGGIVADNIVVESSIASSLPDGQSSGRVRLAGRDWSWSRVVSATDDPDLQRVDIRVTTEEGRAADRILFRTRAS